MHRLTPVASGSSPLDPAALDPARSSFVQIHGVLHYRRKLRLDLRRTDALLEEPWSQRTRHKQIIQPQSLIRYFFSRRACNTFVFDQLLLLMEHFNSGYQSLYFSKDLKTSSKLLLNQFSSYLAQQFAGLTGSK